MKTLVLTGYFLAQCVDLDVGKYNILFEEINYRKNSAHNMIAHWTKDLVFERGKIYNLQIEAECETGFQVKEQPNNSQWLPEDSWVNIGKSYVCNATKVTILSTKTLHPCESYSRFCNICAD